MSLWHQNDVATLIWHHNDVIAPWVRWDVVKGAWNRLKGASEWLSDFNGDSGRWVCQIPPISSSLWLHAWLPMPVLPLMFEFEFEFNPSGWLSSKGTWVSLEIPRIAEDYHLSATPRLSRPLELHCMEQDYSQSYPLRMSTLTHWLLDTLRTSTSSPEINQWNVHCFTLWYLAAIRRWTSGRCAALQNHQTPQCWSIQVLSLMVMAPERPLETACCIIIYVFMQYFMKCQL